MIFTQSMIEQNALREAITKAYRMDESVCIENLLKEISLPVDSLMRINHMAHQLVAEVRKHRLDKSGLDAFLYQYDLSSEEGITLMCLAEALLRIPDSATVDRLIRDKITAADWQAHLRKNESFAVNAATWGLMLTGKLLSRKDTETNRMTQVFKNLAERSGGLVIRKAVKYAMGILSKQFVMGRTIEEALKRARELEKKGYCYSYDMLGEAARTAADAERYFKAYLYAIEAMGKKAKNSNGIARPEISVKLSALHPRYEFSQRERVLAEVVPRLHQLALQAKTANIGLIIDAEEAERLDLSLDILEAVFCASDLAGWNGLGLAVQSYQKRAWSVIDWLAELARKQGRRIMVRLIKGAYWDTEIKLTQEKGLEGYPVFTRKAATDVSFLACAKKILSMPDAFYPQFATHNAHSVAAIVEMAGDRQDYEFQCLHGMGRALYDQVVDKNGMNRLCRIYAPVGNHDDLLPYLVRRLLENGANSSFVNRIVDAKVSIETIIADPIQKVMQTDPKPHPRIPLPINLYDGYRKNSQGVDLTNTDSLDLLAKEMDQALEKQWIAVPTGVDAQTIELKEIHDPADRRRVVGLAGDASVDDIKRALEKADQAAAIWDLTPVEVRADYLERIGELFAEHRSELMALIVREAGKSIADAVSEIREAIDFCNYYAAQARQTLQPQPLPGPTGETNELHYHGRGVMACISPWNFPMAIFTGQVVAALVAGNPVIAKPSEPTRLIAAAIVDLMHEAGIPKDVLQLMPGRGSIVGARLVADERIKGIIFTGSTETAPIINQSLAARQGAIVPLIAETGGQNAMIVDSSALLEQLVIDVMTSAFYSAGQRCSSLRVLFVQEEIAPKLLEMLTGAMAELTVGDPGLLATDIGPVIDKDAQEMLEKHSQRMDKEGKLLYQAKLGENTEHGTFFAPRLYEIKSLSQLPREVFGPILHVIRYRSNELDKVIESINNTRYGLTLGIQSRIDETVRTIQQQIRVGNCYVNRNMIGAVVGVQPFGGEGLSGTGPKAGGPHYLQRLCTERTVTINTTAAGGNAALVCLGED